MPLSFAAEIRALFRNMPDVDSMKDFDLDLSSYEQVKAQSAKIYETLESGTMPCDAPWPAEQVALFKQWVDEGMAP
ncbi:MAG: hypothetical protein A3J28_04285 [Acidobacteria bacterium RIFCSPLOWO2_12_FULL_60_22]|nr:MAG: hypothetical protein A3J28_04285 [Acidobacteria bacterium RIFCSPLOWO2_12_FULL_60_22]